MKDWFKRAWNKVKVLIISALAFIGVLSIQAEPVEATWPIAWDNAGSRQNGELLAPGELAFTDCDYRVVGSSAWSDGGQVTADIEQMDIVVFVEPGDYEVSCKHTDTDGLESDYRLPGLVFTVEEPPNFPPNAPSNLRVRPTG